MCFNQCFSHRKRENHAKMVKDLQTSNGEMSRSLQENRKSIRRLNNAVRELFALYGILWSSNFPYFLFRRKGDVTGLSAGVVATCMVVSQPQNQNPAGAEAFSLLKIYSFAGCFVIDVSRPS